MQTIRWGLAIALVAPTGIASAQTNQYRLHNGVDYFFKNVNVPPKHGDTATRAFPSATQFGAASGGAEGGASHARAIQQDGFEAWSGQRNIGISPSSQPVGFSLLQFRYGGSGRVSTGTVVASTS